MSKVYTLTGYAKAKGITRQAVDDAKKKGKLTVKELPVFVEYNGQKYEIDRRQFVVDS